MKNLSMREVEGVGWDSPRFSLSSLAHWLLGMAVGTIFLVVIIAFAASSYQQ